MLLYDKSPAPKLLLLLRLIYDPICMALPTPPQAVLIVTPKPKFVPLNVSAVPLVNVVVPLA
jgi:hypothetical protein